MRVNDDSAKLRLLRRHDFSEDRDIEIFSMRRRLIAGVVAGLCIVGFTTVLIAGLWVMARWMWP